MSYSNYNNYGDGGFNNDAQYTDMSGGDGTERSTQTQTRSSMTPVTIKQINDASQAVPDGEFSVGKLPLNMVTFVGIVRKIDNTTSAIALTIEDGTGSVDVRKWVDEKVSTAGEAAETYSAWENKYVHVTGALREFNQKKNIQNTTIREVTTHNEVTYHLMSAIQVHLEAEGMLNVGTVETKDSGSSLFLGDSAGDGDASKLNDQDRILGVITAHAGSMLEGVPVKWISDSLNIPEDVVKEHCQALSEQGRVYQGYDEGAFLCV